MTLLDQACRSATNFAPSIRIAAEDPNGASACSASATSSFNRALAAGHAKHADHRGLAGGGVLAGLFADQRRIAFEIEQIVGDLEGLADRRAVTLERRALRRRRLGENAAGLAAEAQ